MATSGASSREVAARTTNGRRQLIAHKTTRRGEIGAVTCRIEADLQLQRAVAAAQGRFGRPLRFDRIDAAGVDLDLALRTAEQLPQRNLLAARVEIPDTPPYIRGADARSQPGRDFRIIPLTVPHILTALRVALGAAWATLVASVSIGVGLGPPIGVQRGL
jgi:hypothetical protein